MRPRRSRPPWVMLSLAVLVALGVGADNCGNSKKTGSGGTATGTSTPQAPCAGASPDVRAACARLQTQWQAVISQSRQTLSTYRPQPGQWPTIAQQIRQSNQAAQQAFQAQRAQAQQLDQQRAAQLQAWWYGQRTEALNRQIQVIRQQRETDAAAAQEAQRRYEQTQQEEYDRRKREYEDAAARASEADYNSQRELEQTRAAYDEVKGP